MAETLLRKYGAATTINFELYETDGLNLKTDAAHASGDTKIMKNEGVEANTANAFVDEGQGYSLALDATEMQAARIMFYAVDQATKAWLDAAIRIETYGHASAQHAFDLDTANQVVASVSGNVDGNVTGSAGSLAAQAKTDVNAEVSDVMKTDTVTLPGQAAPPLAPTMETMLAWLYKVLRNRKTQTTTQWSLMADDETTVDAKATVSDAADTATKQEIVSGP